MDIVFSSTSQLADAIRSRQISVTDVVDAHLAQIAKQNPTLNAVITVDPDHARAVARDADAAIAHGKIWGPLHGVPFTLKDAHATAGMRTTTGAPSLDHVPEADGTVAARLKAAGGILLGKSNVAEMLGDFGRTTNPIFGRTNNPWDPSRTPGGSSGGAAAALAAGMTPFEVGTDLSASIRIPAHFCGVFGLKPTEHRVSLDGLIPGLPPPRSVRIMSCIGPMARTTEDLALIFAIIAGPDGRDTDVTPVPIDDVPVLAIENLRIAVAPTFPGVPVAAVIRDAIEDMARQLQSLGATVDAAPLPDVDVRNDGQDMGALVGMMLGAFQPDAHQSPPTLAQYLEALDRRDRSMIAWERFFGDWDVLLSPPSMTTAFPHRDGWTPLPVDEQNVDYNMAAAHGAIFNYTGHPAVVLPCALDRDGLPIGVQIVGRRWGEARLLGVAKVLESVTGGFHRPPGY